MYTRGVIWSCSVLSAPFYLFRIWTLQSDSRNQKKWGGGIHLS